MSKRTTSLSVTKVNDLVLGAFAHVPRNEQLDHAIRYFSTWSGSDKLFMIIQYGAKVLVPLIELRARTKLRAGLKVDAAQDAKAIGALRAFSSGIGDARMLWRIWGVLPIIQWLVSIEKSQPATRKLLTIERLQGWSMLAYYPLEHVYYLASHKLLPWKLSRRTIDALGLWSTRFWAAYVLLQFLHLREDWKLVKLSERALRAQDKGKASEGANETAAVTATTTSTPAEGWRELAKRKRALGYDAVANVAYLPLTVHWSLEGGALPSGDGVVGVLGLVAGVASFAVGWNGTG